MKKMSEVFDDMPMHINGITCMMDIYQQSNPDETHQVVAKHAAHAINHVDVLADALEDLMEWHVKHVNVIHHPVYDRASKALKAYRGEK